MKVAAVVLAAGLVVAACGADDATSPQTTARGVVTVTTADPAPAPTTAAPPATTAPAATTSQAPPPVDGCANVIAVEAERNGDTYSFAVTVASADTGWDKYADAWVVRAPDGTVLGERVLTHPHVDEQPFTRSLAGVAVPEGVDTVIVAARDSVLGFCGREMPFPIDAVEGG